MVPPTEVTPHLHDLKIQLISTPSDVGALHLNLRSTNGGGYGETRENQTKILQFPEIGCSEGILILWVLLVSVGIPRVAGHAVQVVDSPAGGGLIESAADEVFAGILDLVTADRASLAQAFGVVQVGHVIAEVVPQLIQARALRGVGGEGVAGFWPALVEALPTSFEQRGAERVGPGGRGGRAFVEQLLRRVADGLQRVIDIE